MTSFVGHGARNLIARCVAPHHHLLEPALAAFRAHYARHLLDTTAAYPGIDELLAELHRRGVELAVATNKPGGFARAICDVLFPGRFCRVIGGDEAPQKPDPAMVLRILEARGVVPADALLVGDMDVDEDTARAAGLRFLGAGWGTFGGLRPGAPIAAAPRDVLTGARS